MQKIINIYIKTTGYLDAAGLYISILVLRLLMAYEFGEAGIKKLQGNNWFSGIQDDFPFPFNLVPANISWFMATWFEILGAVALFLGLATRFSALSLIILDLVAWHAVHADSGYNVCQGGYKLPLMFLIALIPILLTGPGKASLDYWIAKKYFPQINN